MGIKIEVKIKLGANTAMDSSPIVNIDHLQQNLVNLNPMDYGYDCQVTI